MTTTWPPLPCAIRDCPNQSTVGVYNADRTSSIAVCDHHIPAGKKWCGTGPHQVIRHDDAPPPEQPSLYDGQGGPA